MASNILTPAAQSKYCLADADRQQLLSTLPPKIEYPAGILPDCLVRRHIKHFPKFTGKTNLSLEEAEIIMAEEIKHQYVVFTVKHGVIFD